MTKKHFLGKSGRTPQNNCTACGRMTDAATPIDSKAARPRPGNISVCIDCGHIMAFADDLTLRNLTDAEMIEIAGDKRILALQRARKMLADAKGKTR